MEKLERRIANLEEQSWLKDGRLIETAMLEIARHTAASQVQIHVLATELRLAQRYAGADLELAVRAVRTAAEQTISQIEQSNDPRQLAADFLARHAPIPPQSRWGQN